MGMHRLWLVVMASLLVSSCRVHLGDCLDGDGPEFTTDNLPNAVLNQEYEARVRVQVDNEPFDDRLSYEFDYEQGELPQGLRFTQFGDERYLYIEGTPTESGSFRFDVTVRVSGSVDLCHYRESETYRLLVTEL
ncbi:MAG: hypothetical protein R3208_13230 [Ketobacteraceae bacterium]|nr:hypothetical protein [Ketobacteraceae bacterium]